VEFGQNSQILFKSFWRFSFDFSQPNANYQSRLSSGERALFPLSPTWGTESPDFLTIIDESHVTLPQLRGMYAGDASRKKTLVRQAVRY